MDLAYREQHSSAVTPPSVLSMGKGKVQGHILTLSLYRAPRGGGAYSKVVVPTCQQHNY